MDIIYTIIGILIGGIIGWLAFKAKAGADKGILPEAAAALNEQINNLNKEKSAALARMRSFRKILIQ